MRKVLLLIALILLSTQPLQAKTAAKSSWQVKQEQADQLYQQAKYSDAFRSYLALAKKGDSFSQYRVSYMYLEGQGQNADVVEAFAWAFLAAQTENEPLVDYRDTVSRMVPLELQPKATRKVDYYMRKWGNRKLAGDMITQTKRELQDCTGSRLGSRCEEVYAGEMPKFWGINPGNASDAGAGASSNQSGTSSTDIGLNPGAPQRDIAYYQGLRQKIEVLDKYIRQTSGTVEVLDLEAGKEQQQADKDENSQ